MSEQQNTEAAGTDAGKAPVFRLEKLYIKDLSFESPNAPEAFFLQEPEHLDKLAEDENLLPLGEKQLEQLEECLGFARAAVVAYVTAEAGRRPLVVSFEDLHWSDDLTVDLVADLLDIVRPDPLEHAPEQIELPIGFRCTDGRKRKDHDCDETS